MSVRPESEFDRSRAPQGPRSIRRDELRIVRAADATPRMRRRRARIAAVTLVAVVAAGLFGVVALHVVLTQNQFRLDRLRTQADAEQAKYQRLRLEVAQLESPEHVVATAQQELGMVTPPTITYLTPVTPAQPQQPPAAAGADTDNNNPQTAGWSVVKPKLAPGP